MNNYIKWFKRVLGVGMLANGGFIVGVFLFPEWLLKLLRIPPPPLIWVRAVVMLVGMISLSYIPALIDPLKHRWVAAYTPLPRLVSAFFFTSEVLLGWPKGFLNLALFDFLFGAVEAVLLYKGFQKEPAEGAWAV